MTGQPASAAVEGRRIWPPDQPGARRGTVSAFDDVRGLGAVLGDDGTTYPFHCTSLVDGTRTVETGTAVVFTPAPGHLGRVEGRDIRRLG